MQIDPFWQAPPSDLAPLSVPHTWPGILVGAISHLQKRELNNAAMPVSTYSAAKSGCSGRGTPLCSLVLENGVEGVACHDAVTAESRISQHLPVAGVASWAVSTKDLIVLWYSVKSPAQAVSANNSTGIG